MQQSSKALTIIAVCALLGGCTTHLVDDERMVDSVSMLGFGFGCNKEPYVLVKGCTDKLFATKRIRLDDIEFNISSSESGRTIYFQQTLHHQADSDFVNHVTLGTTDPGGRALERCFLAIEAKLKEHSISIIKIAPVVAGVGRFGDTHGYVLELDGNGYRDKLPWMMSGGSRHKRAVDYLQTSSRRLLYGFP